MEPEQTPDEDVFCTERLFNENVGWLDNSKLKSFVSVTTKDTLRCSTLIEHSLAS